MPHINNSDKEMYDYSLTRLSNEVEGSPLSHLTYLVYVLAVRWMNSSAAFGTMPDWEQRARALLALNEAQHELRRLYLHEYEDQKINENGEAQ